MREGLRDEGVRREVSAPDTLSAVVAAVRLTARPASNRFHSKTLLCSAIYQP